MAAPSRPVVLQPRRSAVLRRAAIAIGAATIITAGICVPVVTEAARSDPPASAPSETPTARLAGNLSAVTSTPEADPP